MTKLVLKVKGMHCASCSILIDKLLKKQDGIIKSNTSYGAQKVALEFDESKITLLEIDEFVNKLGYDVIRPDEESDTPEDEEKAEKINLKFRFIIPPVIITTFAIVWFF